jgi:flagellar basal body rod protein FlgB
MDLLSLIPDNLSDVLVKIIRFTELRREVLHDNIHRMDETDFRPMDMPVLEFASALSGAVVGHAESHRLIFRDTDHIQFGSAGSMTIQVRPDECAEALLAVDRSEYIRYQIKRRLENTSDRKVAKELLERACGVWADAVRLHSSNAPVRLEWFDRVHARCKNMDPS